MNDLFGTICLCIVAGVVIIAMASAFIYDRVCEAKIKRQKKKHPEYYARRAENNKAISANWNWEHHHIDKLKDELKVLHEVKEYQPYWKRQETEKHMEELRERLYAATQQAEEMWKPVKAERDALNAYAKKFDLYGENKG